VRNAVRDTVGRAAEQIRLLNTNQGPVFGF
jgi:hypothetical protein